MSPVRAWWLLTRAAVRAQAQYRVNVVVTVLAGAVYQGVGLASIAVVLHQFGDLGTWSVAEVTFLYALRLTAHGVWVAPFNQLLSIDEIVREGHFDRFLVRPGNPLLYFLTYRVSLMPTGDLLGGLVLLAVASAVAPIDWSVAAVAYVVLAVLGGACLELGIQLGLAALTFRTLSTQALRSTIDTVFNTFGGYPMHIFSGTAQFVSTFVLPLAFVAYLPGTVLMNRTGELRVPGWLAAGSPVVGCLLLVGAYAIWVRELRRYQSSGH
ncbi:ABC-2 family transporter protein [Plantactinospora sp. B6F1]|uniref:ABC-2 family transporter protein n=1 Tax=Plantactinospora sp. B6F1 TaxID=3158971 RepID=UPI00102D14E7